MRKILLALITIAPMLSFSAHAADPVDIIGDLIGRPARPGRPGRPDRPGRPNRPGRPPGYAPVQCRYVDEGWEEHNFPHRSCGECLSYHGNCIEECYQEEFTCRAVGTDYRGQMQTVYVYSYDQWDAQSRAMEMCRYQGLYNCRVDSCDRQDQQVSQRSCR